MAAQEQVLVVPRRVYESLGAFHGLMADVDRYTQALFAPGVARFMPRDQAETDPSFKQIIPYVILSCGGRVLSYVRGKRAGETRLVGLRSIGIGGHINPVDTLPLFDEGAWGMYVEAVRREVAEEIHVETNHRDRVVAMLNDDSNEVGRVHLGVVHLWTLDAPNVRRREQMITQLEFLPLDELQALRDEMETWSQLCLDGLIERQLLSSGHG